jgi:NTP pyrophosphatase (non-canonical NTP hydrolase)
MKLSEYQNAALTTAQPRAFSLDYLVPMIVGETGELFGQKAKARWHGWSADKLQVELVSEYGDICWGTALLLHTKNVDNVMYDAESVANTGRTRWGNPRDAWQILLMRANYLHMWYSEDETHSYIRGEAQQMWLALEHHCETVTGMPFEVVLKANLTKLAGRVARGTLVGSGDHR